VRGADGSTAVEALENYLQVLSFTHYSRAKIFDFLKGDRVCRAS